MDSIKDYKFSLSPREHKKYRVEILFKNGENKIIDFGDMRFPHYKTNKKIPKELHVFEEHKDINRRNNYLTRAMGIKNKDGYLTFNNPHYSNFWSVHFLW